MSNNHLDLLSPLKQIVPFKGNNAKPVPLKLSGGEIVKGLVIDTFPKNKVLVSIKGQKILAETNTNLKSGETINLKVESGPPKIVLNILKNTTEEITKSNKVTSSIKGLISEKTNIKDLYKDILKLDLNKNELNSILGQKLASKLRVLIESSILKGEQTPKNIKNLIKDSGLMFENRFKEFVDGNITKTQLLNGVQKDIKGTLLEISKVLKDKITLSSGHETKGNTLKNFINDATSTKPIDNVLKNENLQLKTLETSKTALETLKNISKNVNRFIDNIELDQLSNVISKEKTGGLAFNMPFLNNNNIDNARLYVYNREKKNKNQDQGKFYLVLFLNMKKIGDIRVDINIDKKNITTNFSLADKKVSDFFESHKNDLINNLKDYNTNIGFAVRENINETEEELKKDFSLNNLRILDVRV